ncbi:MAG: tetratricopeptide repeat protein [Polyangiales bacterium]
MRITLAGLIAIAGLSAHCATTRSGTHAMIERPTLVVVSRGTRAAPVAVARTDDAELDRLIAAVRERDARNWGRGEWTENECLRMGAELTSVASTIRSARRADASFAAAMVFQRCSITERETAALDRALSVDRQHCGASTRRAVLLDREGSTAAAIELLARAPLACLDATLESARIRLAHLSDRGPARADALRSAAASAIAVLRLDSEHPMAHNILARVYFERAKDSSSSEPYTTAEQACDRAIEAQQRRGIDSASARALMGEALNTRGLAQLANGRIANAIDSFRSATEFAPTEFEPWMNLGLVELRVRDFDGAQQALSGAVRLAGTSTQQFDSHLALGIALRGSRQILLAKAEYEAAQRAMPDRPEPLFHLGMLYALDPFVAENAVTASNYYQAFRQAVEASGQQARFASELASIQRQEAYALCGLRCWPREAIEALMNVPPP